MIIVTGGTKGIGRAVIERFAAEGKKIITCARNKSELAVLKKEIEKAHKTEILTFVADFSKKNDVKKFADFVLSKTDFVDVLVNNVGFFVPGQIQNETENTLEKTTETNLYSAYHLTRAFLPLMQAKKAGHIFVICSTASITAYTNGGSYCISKFGLYGMTKVLREELKKDNIRVTAVLPGATLTASWNGTDLPDERFMPSEDVAEMIFSAFKVSKRTVVEEILMRPQLGDIV
jgi:short-subunit dehydrogenase